MAKAQGKKAAAGAKKAAKKVAVRVKSAVGAAKKRVVPKKAPPPAKKPAPKKPAPGKPEPKKPAPKKPAPPKPAPKKPAPKPAPKAAAQPVKKAAEKVKTAVKVVQAAAKKVVEKAVAAKPAAAKTAAPEARTTPAAAPVAAKAVAKPAAEEKKRGRRARTRIHSSGAPVAMWLSTEKPRSASFIPAPPRAEAPSAIAAAPASSDRLIRPEDVSSLAVRTVPVRIDIEHSAGRFYVLANPMEVTVKVGEGIEWDFRYIGGADVSVDEIIIECDKPSPFPQAVYRTRKPGGARPHRQLSGGAMASAAGKRVQYRAKAMSAFKTELASNTQIWVNVTA